jgi:hypothetical protein
MSKLLSGQETTFSVKDQVRGSKLPVAHEVSYDVNIPFFALMFDFPESLYY